MKIKNYLVMVLVALCAIACSDNDDEISVSTGVTGSYDGYVIASCAYFQNSASDGQTVVITASGTAGDRVNISYVSDTWGTFTFTDAAVTLSGGVYTIEGSGTTEMGHTGSTSTYECTIAATLDGNKAVTSLVFSVPAVMGGMTLTFIQGDMPAVLAIAGSYSGTLDLTVAGNSAGSIEGETVTIAAAEDGTVTMTLAGFSVGTMALGDVTVTGVAVTAEDNGTYTLSGEVNAQVAMGESTINVTGTVEGTVTSAGVANLTFVLTPGAMPMAITAVFTTAAAE